MMSRRSPRVLLVALAAIGSLLAFPALAFADGLPHDGSVVIQVKSDVTIPAGVHRDALIVIGGNAVVMGEVNTIVVVDGTATLTGARAETLVVAGGTADVGEGSVVGQVRTLDSVYHAAPGAVVDSYQTVEPGAIAAAIAPVAVAAWLGFAFAYLLAGLIVAAIGGAQLRRAGALITREPASVVVGALGVLIGLPILIVALVVTIIGIPAAFALAVVGVPILWFVGSLAVAVRIGDWLLLSVRGRTEAMHPLVAAFLGMLVVGVLSVIPVVGFVIGVAGAGAAMLMAWRAAFGGASSTPVSAAQPTPMSA